ncbi:uncharacterized protein LOC135833671 [Planococcus citri]|uniref:uncharacterized protein LOC135833671 n=1 Tax=Planococcus citri TaxID=170843 RepID=UPI0031F93FA8
MFQTSLVITLFNAFLSAISWLKKNMGYSTAIESFIKIPLLIMQLISFICVIVHFYKFFTSKTKQRLATKNLTFYCGCLALKYSCAFYCTALASDFSKTSNKYCIRAFVFIHQLVMTMALFKTIMALDIYLCFRKIALFLETHSSGPQNGKFVVYCTCSIGVPLIWRILLEFVCSDGRDIDLIVPWTALAVRIARVGPILGAFWYLWSASFDKNVLFAKYSMHIRLIMMIGGVSAVSDAAQFVNMIFFTRLADVDGLNAYLQIHFIAAALEGVIIGMCFTFKDDTFGVPSSLPTTGNSTSGTSMKR